VASRQLPTTVARVQAQVKSCGICNRQSCTGAGFLRVLRFPLPSLIPPTDAHSSSSVIRGWYNRPISGRRTNWTQSHPTPKKKLKHKKSDLLSFPYPFLRPRHTVPFTRSWQHPRDGNFNTCQNVEELPRALWLKPKVNYVYQTLRHFRTKFDCYVEISYS
jgi:hypothetical protein